MVTVRSFLQQMFTIDRRMIPSKLFYILSNGLIACHTPFLNIFFISVGLTASQAGFISGIRFVSSALAGPVWGILADYTGRRKIIVVALCLGSLVSFFPMPWIARVIHPQVKYMLHNSTRNSSFQMTNDGIGAGKHTEITTLFYVFLAITVFGSMFVMSLPGYVESMVMKVVKSEGRNTKYGAQRLFASAGFAAGNLLAGFAADHYNHPRMTNYTAVFYLYLPICLLLIPAGSYVVNQGNWEMVNGVEDMEKITDTPDRKVGKTNTEDSISKNVFLALKRIDVLILLMTVFISGLGTSIMVSFSYILLREEMNISKTRMTFVFATECVANVVTFLSSSKIIKKMGTIACIIIGMLLSFVRLLSISYSTKLWQVALIQLFYGFGFALSWSAIMEHTHKVTPKEIHVTMVNIVCTIYLSISAIVGNMAGGVLYDTFGGRILFRYSGALCGAWTIFMIMYYGGKYFKDKHSSEFEINTRCQPCHHENVNPTESGSTDIIISISRRLP